MDDNRPHACCVMADLEGTQLSESERNLLQHPLLGGIILFARNFDNPKQLRALTHAIKQVRDDVLIAVDQEGGRIQRFREGFTALPSMQRIGELYAKQPEQAIELANNTGWLMATELLACGVDLSFAPVLDVDCGVSNVIGSRSFSACPNTVTVLAGALCEGMRHAGMASVGKHFPGHGGVVGDSHTDSPVDARTKEAISAHDLVPFKQLIKTRALNGIMPAHVTYPKIDASNTAGFSRVWLHDILQQTLGFEGCIFSDDLSMQGAAYVGGAVERARAALNAGCHALLVCNQPSAAHAVLSSLELPYHQGELTALNLLAAMKVNQSTAPPYDGERIRAQLQWLRIHDQTYGKQKHTNGWHYWWHRFN